MASFGVFFSGLIFEPHRAAMKRRREDIGQSVCSVLLFVIIVYGNVLLLPSLNKLLIVEFVYLFPCNPASSVHKDAQDVRPSRLNPPRIMRHAIHETQGRKKQSRNTCISSTFLRKAEKNPCRARARDLFLEIKKKVWEK